MQDVGDGNDLQIGVYTEFGTRFKTSDRLEVCEFSFNCAESQSAADHITNALALLRVARSLPSRNSPWL